MTISLFKSLTLLITCGLGSSSFARTVTAVLDLPEFIAREHAVSVRLKLGYENEQPTVLNLLARDELSQGVTSTEIELRAETPTSCTFYLSLSRNPSQSAEPWVDLIAPADLLNEPSQFLCNWSEDGATVILGIPYEFDDVTINIRAEALNNHGAFAMVGILNYPGLGDGAYRFHQVSTTEPSAWRVHVIAPALTRQVEIVWTIDVDAHERQEFIAPEPVIEIR